MSENNYDENSANFSGAPEEEHPPAFTESIGAHAPAKPAASKKIGTERDRLDRIGVKSDDFDAQERGKNVKAEGHQHGEPLEVPRPENEDPNKGEAEFVVNNYGVKVPADSLGGVQTKPNDPPPAPTPGKPADPFMPTEPFMPNAKAKK